MEHRALPERIRRAVAEQRRPHPQPTAEQRSAKRGDLVAVAAGDVVRIVCVTEVTATHLVAVLCSNEIEMATGRDVVLHRSGTYDPLLEAECYLVLVASQVRGVVGTVDLDAVRASLFSDGESVEPCASRPGYSVGTPLTGVWGPRRAFMARELDDMVILRNPAQAVLFGDGWNPGYPPLPA